MQTAELKRYFDYVEMTSRPGAPVERRQAMSAHLTGRTCSSARALVAAVGGNKKDEAWVGQALKAGRITRYGEALGLPSARYSADEAGQERWWLDLNRVCMECPMLTQETCIRLQDHVIRFFDELEAQDDEGGEDDDNEE